MDEPFFDMTRYNVSSLTAALIPCKSETFESLMIESEDRNYCVVKMKCLKNNEY